MRTALSVVGALTTDRAWHALGIADQLPSWHCAVRKQGAGKTCLVYTSVHHRTPVTDVSQARSLLRFHVKGGEVCHGFKTVLEGRALA